jgi:release factor glutamine methyltransferase
MGNVYKPSDDTWLLIETLEKRKPRGYTCLDLGSGTGILGLYALLNGYCRRVVFIDIDEDAVESTRRSIELNNVGGGIVVQTDAYVLREGSFDLALANPPYLPSEEETSHDVAVNGGLEGWETVVYFIEYASKALRARGLLYLVYSSLTKPEVVMMALKVNGFKLNYALHKHFFFEVLYSVECVKLATDQTSTCRDRRRC